MDCPEGKEITVTSGAASIHRGNTRCMQLCDHEEADTRLIFRLKDVCLNNCSKYLVRTVDIDVVVILTGKFHYCIVENFGGGKH